MEVAEGVGEAHSSPTGALCGSSALGSRLSQHTQGLPAQLRALRVLLQPSPVTGVPEQAVTTTASPGPALTGPTAGRCQSPAAAAWAHLCHSLLPP